MPNKGNYGEGGFLLFSVSEGVGHHDGEGINHGGEGIIEFLLFTRRPNQESGSFDWSQKHIQPSRFSSSNGNQLLPTRSHTPHVPQPSKWCHQPRTKDSKHEPIESI